MLMTIKAFNRWGTDGIEVGDTGLRDYISLKPRIVPKTGATYAKNRFHKSKTFIVERLINKVMVPGHKGKKHHKSSGHLTGKGNLAYNIVKETLSLIEKNAKKNPIEVLVRAIENAAPREEIVTVEYGGARYTRATECAPQRRIDLALRHITQGAYSRSFQKKRPIEVALAEEIVAAYNSDSSSNAISKKRDLERQADSSR